MRILIIRHGKVNFHWSKWCTSGEFDKECSAYDRASVKDIIYKIPQTEYQDIYISTLSRSEDTAHKLFSKGRLRKTALINEVPLRSSFDTRKKMPLWFWNVSGRLQWLLNHPRQSEGCRQTRQRAGRFIEILCKGGSDSVVVTHRFYMHTLLQEMRRAGFRMEKSQANYKNGEYIVAER